MCTASILAGCTGAMHSEDDDEDDDEDDEDGEDARSRSTSTRNQTMKTAMKMTVPSPGPLQPGTWPRQETWLQQKKLGSDEITLK
jgi:hypothetical protein